MSVAHPSSSHSSPYASSVSSSAAPHSSHVHLPPLHGVNLPSTDNIPMTAPFTVPYTALSSGSPAASASTAGMSPATPVVVRAPTDGMAAKMVAGGLSCMLISALLNPMDVVKIRLQTQNQLSSGVSSGTPIAVEHSLPTSAGRAAATLLAQPVPSTQSGSPLHLSMYADSKYKGMTNGLLTIYREEGYARGLMRGSAALLADPQ